MRQLGRNWRPVVGGVAIVLCVFHLYTGLFGVLPSLQQRAVHVGLALTLVFILYPIRKAGAGKSGVPAWDLLFIVLTLVSAGYIFQNFLRFLPFMPVPPTIFELILAAVTLVLVIESGRRTVGIVFPFLTALIFLYALFGQYIPGKFGHAPIAWSIILETIYLSAQGIWGFLTGMSATYLVLFIIFGAFMYRGGGGQTFIDLSTLLLGRFRGGPAKVSVVASSLFSMVSGSALANVAITGNFTIPLMKKTGYSPEFAAAVESTASTAGSLTPPVMGTTAFIMAELLGIPYLTVVIAAFIPAFLYYVVVFSGVHFEAVKRGLRPLRPEELPRARAVLTWQRILGLFLPVGTLLFMLIEGYSLTTIAGTACLVALVVPILLHIVTNPSLRGIKEALWGIIPSLEAGGRALIVIVPIMVCASIVVFLLNFTGLGLKFSELAMQVGQFSIILSIIMTAILIMFLGTGLPTMVAYLLGIVIAGPLLINWGISPIAAHLFAIYYSVAANLTPPVCPAVFVAAGIAKSNWLKSALLAVRLSPVLYIMPFVFIFRSALLAVGTPGEIVVAVVTTTIGGVAISGGLAFQFVTRCNIVSSLLLMASGVLLFLPRWEFNLLGAAIVGAIVVKQLYTKRAATRKGG